MQTRLPSYALITQFSHQWERHSTSLVFSSHLNSLKRNNETLTTFLQLYHEERIYPTSDWFVPLHTGFEYRQLGWKNSNSKLSHSVWSTYLLVYLWTIKPICIFMGDYGHRWLSFNIKDFQKPNKSSICYSIHNLLYFTIRDYPKSCLTC